MMILTRLQNGLRHPREWDCRHTQEAMSAFIDSMTSPEEASHVEAHIGRCNTCRRQLQGYISLRHFMAAAPATAVPEDLELETRIRLSRVRARDICVRFDTHFQNLLRPHAIPALASILVTFLGFGLLLTSFGPSARGTRYDQKLDTLWLQTPPRMADSLMRQLAELDLDQVTVDLAIDRQGKAFSSVILNRPEDPVVDQWLRDVLLLGEFHPATIYGRPVASRLVLSFVGVRGSPVV